MRWVQLCGSLSILWHCLSLGLEWKLTFSSPVATAEFSKFVDILSDFKGILALMTHIFLWFWRCLSPFLLNDCFFALTSIFPWNHYEMLLNNIKLPCILVILFLFLHTFFSVFCIWIHSSVPFPIHFIFLQISIYPV